MTKTPESIVASLVDALSSHDLVMVKFRTKSGTERVMGCSQQLSAIPEELHEGRFDYRLNHESILCVFDFQNSGWRSFRRDSVISYEIVA